MHLEDSNPLSGIDSQQMVHCCLFRVMNTRSRSLKWCRLLLKTSPPWRSAFNPKVRVKSSGESRITKKSVRKEPLLNPKRGRITQMLTQVFFTTRRSKEESMMKRNKSFMMMNQMKDKARDHQKKSWKGPQAVRNPITRVLGKARKKINQLGKTSIRRRICWPSFGPKLLISSNLDQRSKEWRSGRI